MDKAIENLSLLKDIRDIDDMLNQYCQSGFIDRERAISKIRELRITNIDIEKAVAATLPFNFVPVTTTSSTGGLQWALIRADYCLRQKAGCCKRVTGPLQSGTILFFP